MIITQEVNEYNELREKLWCCEETLKEIEENNLEEEFINYLDELFTEPIDLTHLNDYIRFDFSIDNLK